MTTRDPRSRDPSRPEAQGQGLDPTQSLSLEAGDDPYEPPHPSLALGTHDVGRQERTKIESPAARAKTPTPAAPRGGPPPIPRGATEEPDRVGSVLGSYKILELLGRGGMGYVFRAEHVKLGREVALKLLRSDYARRRDAVARFFQEARTVNRVRHRNIVDVTDFVELDDGTTFIIMELLRGESLGKWARTGIDLPRALAVLVQICDGLGAAHEVGVIHRDLKPDNVIVVPTTDGAELVKLLDFGVAKLVNRDDEDVGFQTAAGSVIGTPAYMSPEQAGGMAVDARSDIYSLGAIMYELFCGQPMFRGRSFGEYVRKHLTEVPVAPRATPNGAQIDPRLEALIMKCLEKDPIQRFASIHQLRDALLSMLGGMETLLPGLASLAASGVRSLAASGMRSLAGANANVGASVTLAPIPQLPAAAIPQLPTIGVPPSGSHASHASQQVYFSQVGPASGIRPPGTPWWVWFVGGAIAVGLGIGAAVWYAGRTGLPSAPAPVAARPPVTQPAPIAEQPAPIAEPPAPGAEQPAPSSPPAAAPLVEIRLDSTPEGTVFAEGGATALCRTPCTYSLDPRAGGLPDRRTFVVRSEGYRDASIVVDLQGTQRDFALTLEPLEPPRDEARPAGKAAGRPRVTGRKPIRPRPDAQAGKPDGARPDDARPDDGKPDDPRPDDGKAGAPDPAEPDDARPPKKKPEPGPIDPADTLDPFRPKSPK